MSTQANVIALQAPSDVDRDWLAVAASMICLVLFVGTLTLYCVAQALSFGSLFLLTPHSWDLYLIFALFPVVSGGSTPLGSSAVLVQLRVPSWLRSQVRLRSSTSRADAPPTSWLLCCWGSLSALRLTASVTWCGNTSLRRRLSFIRYSSGLILVGTGTGPPLLRSTSNRYCVYSVGLLSLSQLPWLLSL